MESVEFNVRSVRVAADLYTPDVESGERRPALVLGQGFSAVKEALAPHAELLRSAGYVVLVIDYRTFGSSGGEIRGQLFPAEQVEDYRSAITYLERRPEVEPDRIGIWGTSFGGGIALAVAAADQRVRVTISQIPIVDGGEWMRWLRTPDLWHDLIDRLNADRRRRFDGEPSARVPVVASFASREFAAIPADPSLMAMVGSLPALFPTHRRDITIESLERIIEFRPEGSIALIAPRPLLVLAVTGYETLHPLAPILRAYAAAGEPKQLALLPFDQLGLYFADGFERSLSIAIEFLRTHLPVGEEIGGRVPRTVIEGSGFKD